MNYQSKNNRSTSDASKRLSWLLRHGATEAGVAIDSAGWVKTADVMRVLHLTKAQIDDAVANNNKSRFAVDGEYIRAVQGHSLPGVVSLESLEASWQIYAGNGENGLIWHGTNRDHLDSILKTGLKSMQRTHVHLAETTKSHVGKRANVDILLGIDVKAMRESGNTLFQSDNGVVLARYVPANCIAKWVQC